MGLLKCPGKENQSSSAQENLDPPVLLEQIQTNSRRCVTTSIILVCRASEEEGSWEAQAKCLAFISISRLLIYVASHPWVILIHRS